MDTTPSHQTTSPSPPSNIGDVSFREATNLPSFRDIGDLPAVLKEVNNRHGHPMMNGEEHQRKQASVMTILANKMSKLTLATAQNGRQIGQVVSRLDFSQENPGKKSDKENDSATNGVISPNEKHFGLRQAYLEAKKQLKYAKVTNTGSTFESPKSSVSTEKRSVNDAKSRATKNVDPSLGLTSSKVAMTRTQTLSTRDASGRDIESQDIASMRKPLDHQPSNVLKTQEGTTADGPSRSCSTAEEIERLQSVDESTRSQCTTGVANKNFHTEFMGQHRVALIRGSPEREDGGGVQASRMAKVKVPGTASECHQALSATRGASYRRNDNKDTEAESEYLHSETSRDTVGFRASNGKDRIDVSVSPSRNPWTTSSRHSSHDTTSAGPSVATPNGNLVTKGIDQTANINEGTRKDQAEGALEFQPVEGGIYDMVDSSQRKASTHSSLEPKSEQMQSIKADASDKEKLQTRESESSQCNAYDHEKLVPSGGSTDKTSWERARVEPSPEIVEWINVLNGRKNRLNWQERRQALSSIKEAIDGDGARPICMARILEAFNRETEKLASALEFHLNELRPSIVMKTLELILSLLKTDASCKKELGAHLFQQIAELAVGHTSSSTIAAVCVSFLIKEDPTLCQALVQVDDISDLRDFLDELTEDPGRPSIERSNAKSASALISKTFQNLDPSRMSSSSSQNSETADSKSRVHSRTFSKPTHALARFSDVSSFSSHNVDVASQHSGKVAATSAAAYPATSLHYSSVPRDKKLAAPRSSDVYSTPHPVSSGGSEKPSSYSSVSGSETSRIASHTSRATGTYTLDDLERARREGIQQGVAEANTVNQVENEQMKEELEMYKQDKQELLKTIKVKDEEIQDVSNCLKQLQERYRQAKHAIGLYEDKEVFLMKQNNVLKKDYASLEKWSKDLKASAEKKLASSLKNIQSLTETYETLKAAKGGSGVIDKVVQEENQSLKARAFDDMQKIESLKASVREKEKLLEEKTAELEHKTEKCKELEKLCEDVLTASDKKMLQ